MLFFFRGFIKLTKNRPLSSVNKLSQKLNEPQRSLFEFLDWSLNKLMFSKFFLFLGFSVEIRIVKKFTFFGKIDIFCTFSGFFPIVSLRIL